MTGFSNELEKTNLRLEESLRTERELREVVPVQGDRIDRLETERIGSGECSQEEVSYVPVPK